MDQLVGATTVYTTKNQLIVENRPTSQLHLSPRYLVRDQGWKILHLFLI